MKFIIFAVLFAAACVAFPQGVIKAVGNDATRVVDSTADAATRAIVAAGKAATDAVNGADQSVIDLPTLFSDVEEVEGGKK